MPELSQTGKLASACNTAERSMRDPEKRDNRRVAHNIGRKANVWLVFCRAGLQEVYTGVFAQRGH
jgi:hypothetical protein